MAIIIKGKSKCSICNKVLENDHIIGWNAFLNKEHTLWEYSDTGMHKECFNNWKYKEEFEYLYNYQPLIDFNNPKLKEWIKEHGMPDWLKEIQKYRKNNHK